MMLHRHDIACIRRVLFAVLNWAMFFYGLAILVLVIFGYRLVNAHA